MAFHLLKINKKSIQNLTPKPISILIAVRNEASNIHHFLDQILRQSYSLYEIVIIDDHSIDETISILKRIQNPKLKWFQLPNNKAGKKEAIKFGLSKCNYSWVIFTDADVTLKNDWLVSYIPHTNKEVMIISPVFIQPKLINFIQMFQHLDFAAMQYITFASIISKTPFLCSGANMAVPKNKAIEFYNHINTSIPSGDDIFLLHKHVEEKGEVTLNIQPSSIVTVNACDSFINALKQRIRWASKAKFYKNKIAIFISLLIFTIHLGLLIGIAWGIFHLPLLIFTILLIFIKMIIDLPIFFIGNNIIPLQKKWQQYYPLVSLTYILYISTIAIWALIAPITWKNRTWKNDSQEENK